MILFGWHIELKHTFYKSRRDEWVLRWWKPIKYVRPINIREIKRRNEPHYVAPYKAEPKSYIDERGDVRAWPEIPDGEGVKDA